MGKLPNKMERITESEVLNDIIKLLYYMVRVIWDDISIFRILNFSNIMLHLIVIINV